MLELLHRGRVLELGQDILFEHQDDFADRFLENGVSRDLIQTCKSVSATFPCVQREVSGNGKTAFL